MFVIESTLLLQDSERKVLHADGQNVSIAFKEVI